MNSINGRNYNISDIAKWFHNLNHFNFKLERIKNSTFDIEDQEYVKSLLVFVLLPICILVLILLVYLFYSICICICGTTGKSKKNIRVECKVFIFLFGLVCGLTFIVGLYGSWKIHEGVHSVHNSTEDAVKLFNSIKSDTKNISEEINIEKDVNSLEVNIEKVNVNNDFTTSLEQLKEISKLSIKANKEVREANGKLAKLDIDSLPQQIEKYENIRWIATIFILCALAILGFIFAFGICSRCLLALFTIFGVISLIMGSAIVALSFGGTVGISDFCFEAKPFIKSQMNGKVEATISDYYIDCLQNNSPIGSLLDSAKFYLINATQTVKQFEAINQKLDELCKRLDCQNVQQDIKSSTANIITQLDKTEKLVTDLINLADCRRINNDLNESLNSLCSGIIEGMVMILSNGIAASFCFIILIFCATCALR